MPRRCSRSLIVVLAIAALCGCSANSRFQKALKVERSGDYLAAAELFKAQLSKKNDPKRQSEIYAHIGECYWKLQHPTEAFGYYRKALEADNSNVLAHLRVGELYLVSGSAELASEEANAALSSAAPSPDALVLLGSAAVANGDDALARDAFKRVLSIDPKRLNIAVSLAEVYSHSGDAENAREVLRKATESQPRSSMPWLALGRLEEQEGRIQQAEQSYRNAVAAEDTPETNLRLAQFLERAARVSEAEQVLQHVDAQRPEMPIALADFQLFAGKSTRATDAYAAAIRSTEPAARNTPRAQRQEREHSTAQLAARLVEADLHAWQTGDHANAHTRADALQRAHIDLDTFRPKLDAATVAILECELALAGNDLPAAKIHAGAAVSLAPDSAPARYVDGLMKWRSHEPAAARAAFDAALDNDSSYVPARLAMTQLLLENAAIRDAEHYIIAVVREEPGNYQGLILFARALLANRSLASAKVIANRASIVDPTAAEPHIILGEAALRQDHVSNAFLQYQQAVLLEPHSRDAIDGLTSVYRHGNITRPMLLNMEAIADREPRSATLMEITGRLFADKQMNTDAQRCLSRAVAMEPGRSSAITALAQVLAVSGNEAAAVNSVGSLPQSLPMLAGLRAQDIGNLPLAAANYEAAVREGDPTGAAANNLAWIYAQQQTKLDRALELANAARDRNDEDPAVLDTLGFVHLKRREYSDAINVLERAHHLAEWKQPTDDVRSAIRHHLIAAYVKAGLPDRARALERK